MPSALPWCLASCPAWCPAWCLAACAGCRRLTRPRSPPPRRRKAAFDLQDCADSGAFLQLIRQRLPRCSSLEAKRKRKKEIEKNMEPRLRRRKTYSPRAVAALFFAKSGKLLRGHVVVRRWSRSKPRFLGERALAFSCLDRTKTAPDRTNTPLCLGSQVDLARPAPRGAPLA